MSSEIYDSFGAKVNVGDWIIYPNHYKHILTIGKIIDFTKKGNPRVSNVVNGVRGNKLFVGLIQLKDYKHVIQSAFVKCFDETLIRTLEDMLSNES